MLIFYDKIFLKNNNENDLLRHHIIVSLTTNRKGIKSFCLDEMIKSLLKQTLKPYKILLSMNKNNKIYINDFLKLMIKKNILEVIFVKEDLKYFNKYYYIPKKYKKYIIIVFDDNTSLESQSLENFFKSYLLYPNAISARRVYKMTFNEKWLLKPFKFWEKDYKREKFPKFHLFAIHGDGALFPPNVLHFPSNFIHFFKKVIKAHDYIIKYFELNKNLKTVFVNSTRHFFPLKIDYYQKYNRIFLISPNEFQLKNDFGKKFKYNSYNNIIKKKVKISNITENYFLNNKNYNNITKDTLLISMTSYPARIVGIYEVFLSLLYQSVDIGLYQCFLTLAKDEFINGEKDLPVKLQKLISNGWIKLIWYHNIFSHKKLIPIIQIYPENDVLVVDDDIKRIHNFIEIFQKEHQLYPTDIICGNLAFHFNNKINLERLKGYKGKNVGEINPVPNIIFQTARPANGFGGVLYPKHTFSDKRFFNETLFMNISPTSDELWQYAFIIIENKIIRQTSIIIDNSINIIKNSQNLKTSLFRVNKDKYRLINNKLISLFPEYKNNSLKRQKKILVSLSSYKNRFKKLILSLKSIFNNSMKPSKVVLTILNEDFLFFKKKLKKMFNNDSIELIVTNIDLLSHNKYFEVMKKYRDYAIIIISDDLIYTSDLIKSLYDSYVKNPNCIHARCVNKFMYENNNVLPYEEWLKEYTFEFNPSFYLSSVSRGGVLFPPNILNISDDNINDIYKCINEEEIYIKYLSLKRNIKIIWVPNKFCSGVEQLTYNNNQKNILNMKNRIEKLNVSCINLFKLIKKR